MYYFLLFMDLNLPNSTGVILVSSELEEVMGLADRAYLIKNGKTFDQIYPKNSSIDKVLFSLFGAKKENKIINAI